MSHTSSAPHVPVMLNDVLRSLSPTNHKCYVDGTFGAGGYTRAILDAADCQVHAFDRDPDAIAAGQEMVRAYGGRLTLHHAAFGSMQDTLAAVGVAHVDGVVLDIGVSSMQLDQAERGFSFQKDGPLDMRMAQDGESAADFLNTRDEGDIALVLRAFGEERQSRRLARAILKHRDEQPLQTTQDLVRIVESVLGSAERHKLHPATRTFQALRIYINNELGELVRALTAAEHVLREAGRLIVVAFHSLEDRIVKRFLQERARDAAQPSRHMPQVQEEGAAPSFREMHRRALKASDDEIEKNPRSRSARLRAAERTSAPAFELNPDALGLPQGVML